MGGTTNPSVHGDPGYDNVQQKTRLSEEGTYHGRIESTGTKANIEAAEEA